MKSVKRIFVAMIAVLAISATASAQLSFGVKAGLKVNKISFDEKALASDNQAGFTGGVMAEFMLPVLNLGVDASLMYVHNKVNVGVDGFEGGVDKARSYIEVPVNLKWKIGLPIAGNIVSPYIFTGPCFSFLAGKAEIEEALKEKKVDVSWNIGVGVQLLRKLQISAGYGFGLNNTLEIAGVDGNWTDIDGKRNCWTITAAYLF